MKYVYILRSGSEPKSYFGITDDMAWLPTLIITGIAIALGLVARWRMAMPMEPGRVRLVPWTALLFLAVLVVMMMGAHMLTLAGVRHDQ
jgi:hypothetical protein